MKEILRRRLTVTSSLNEISTDQLEGGGVIPPALIPSYSRLLGQIFKDDVNGFTSKLDISFMSCKNRLWK